MIEGATPSLDIQSTNCSNNVATEYGSGMRLHPHGSLALKNCQFVSNRHNNVLALFTSSGSQTITCLFFVSNTCGNSGDHRGLIYVAGAHTFTHGVFLDNNIDSGAAIGFGSSGSVTLSNWLIDEQLTTSGNGQVNVAGTGTAPAERRHHAGDLSVHNCHPHCLAGPHRDGGENSNRDGRKNTHGHRRADTVRDADGEQSDDAFLH
jgi:hypothetical protein